MRLVTLLPLLLCGACTWFSGDSTALITSEPLGARIFVDGVDTERTTPARLELGGLFGSDHALELRRVGYRPEHRMLVHRSEGYTTRWANGGEVLIPAMPWDWTFGDFLLPFGVRWAYVPGEVHVKMYRTDEPLLGFDLLRAKATPAMQVSAR